MRRVQGRATGRAAAPGTWRRAAAAGLLLAAVAVAALVPGTAGAKPGDDERVGDWAFQAADRPAKAVLVGGSVAAFTGGGFADQLQGACRNLEVKNLAVARYGAAAIKRRFEMQVLQNPALAPGWGGRGDRWVLVLGGLNSVGNPEQTNADVLGIYRAARGAGLKVMGLTLGPWGDESDKRWAGFAGVGRQDNTRRAVDFVMGRLSPAEALGRLAGGQAAWQPGDLPDLAVDLYDSDLRDREAALRDEAPLRGAMDGDPVVRKRREAVPADRQAAERARLLRQAVEIPRFFLRADLRSFDHIHPNREGHRIIAKALCEKAPADWGCDCALLAPGVKAPPTPRAAPAAKPAKASRPARRR